MDLRLTDVFDAPASAMRRRSERSAAGAVLVQLIDDLTTPPERPTEIRLLGPTQLIVHGVPVTGPDLRRERVRHLIAYVALHRHATRDQLAGTFWPDLDDEGARRNLRVNLSYVQRVLEPDRPTGQVPFLLQVVGTTLRLVGEPWVSTDIERFERLLALADDDAHQVRVRRELEHLEEAVALVTGTPLVDVRDEEWARHKAHYLLSRAVRALIRAAELRHDRGDHDRAVVHGLRALELEPWSEPAYRIVASAHLELGDRASALRILDDCWRQLDELGVEPDDCTRALTHRARTGWALAS